MKILVIGFQRSGTTLLKDLIWKHRGVKHMFHEVSLMKFPKKKLMTMTALPDKMIRNNFQGVNKYSYVVKFNRKKDNWGEKIPYWTPKIFKGFNGTVAKYCNTWNTYFGKEARILHIVRHPFDVAISTKKRGFTKDVGLPLKTFKRTVPIVINSFNNVLENNIMHVQFEKLVMNPEEYLKEIYAFCKLRNNDKVVSRVVNNKNIFRFKKVNPNRAYSYKNEKFKFKKNNISEVLKVLNGLNGVHYDG